jgi:hypothetical protein
MCSVPQVADALHRVLHDRANELARTSGFVKRASKMTGALWVQTLVFTWLSNARATLEEMAQTAAALGLHISAQGIQQRFSEAAATLLKEVLEEALGAVVQAHAAATPLLARFNGVYLFDSTVIALPDVLASLWKGCGGRVEQGSAAALKVQVVFDLARGRLQGVLQAGRDQDRNAPTQTWELPKGALKIADLGYFSVRVLSGLHQGGVFFLSRIQVGTHLALENEFLDLVAVGRLLREQQLHYVDLPIRLGAAMKLPCRLLAVRVPPKVAQERRRRLHFQAARKWQPVSQARLELADWNLYVTNAGAELLSLDEALVLLRARWQIELLFKLWKSVGEVDTWRSEQEWRVLCEVYTKLLALVVQHWLFLVSCWQYCDRSLVKASKTVARQALALAASFGERAALEAAIAVIVRCLGSGCRMNRRKKRPNTWQLLDDAPPLGGLG